MRCSNVWLTRVVGAECTQVMPPQGSILGGDRLCVLFLVGGEGKGVGRLCTGKDVGHGRGQLSGSEGGLTVNHHHQRESGLVHWSDCTRCRKGARGQRRELFRDTGEVESGRGGGRRTVQGRGSLDEGNLVVYLKSPKGRSNRVPTRLSVGVQGESRLGTSRHRRPGNRSGAGTRCKTCRRGRKGVMSSPDDAMSGVQVCKMCVRGGPIARIPKKTIFWEPGRARGRVTVDID